MGKFQDLTGMTFGRLTVIERAPNIGKQPAWRCKCSCGKECVVRASSLKSKHTTTCGCGEGNNKHGMSKTSIYHTWANMLERCENPNRDCFDRYGGRGIKVCERWHDFNNFYADVSILPHFNEKGYTLDRIRVNEDYEPGNVRWADRNTQNRNTRRNVKVIYNGVEMCLKDAANLSGINYETLRCRYHAGDRDERLFRPVEEKFSRKCECKSSC